MSTKSQVHGLHTPWRAVAIAAAVFALILGSIVMVAMTLSELGNSPNRTSLTSFQQIHKLQRESIAQTEDIRFAQR